MKPTSVIRGTAVVVGAVWSVVTALAGWQFEGAWQRGLTSLPLVLVVLFMAWDRWLWKWKLFVKHVGVPDLNGTWLGEFESLRIDKGQKIESTGPAAIVIRQTYTKLSVRLITAESMSYSILTHVVHLESGEYRVNYQYENSPKLKYRQKMPTHRGAAELTVPSARGRELRGEYWTDRLSQGTLELKWVSDKAVSTLQAAQHLPDKSSERDD